MVIREPIEIRCGKGTKRDPHFWVPAYAGRTTPTRLFYRWKPYGEDLGPLRLDCEGKTWRKAEAIRRAAAATEGAGDGGEEYMKDKLTIPQAVYLAGVAFSLGVRLGQIPMFGPDAVSGVEGVCLFFASVLVSFATSWLGAGLALGNS